MKKENFIAYAVIAAIIVLLALFAGPKERIGCQCVDGSSSYAKGRGACSHHGGVRYWKYEYWWE